MLKTASELIAKAQTMISCLDISSTKSLYENSENTIIDVREPEEATISKLKNSINIPRGLVEMKVPNICPKPDVLILLHCAGGGRASLAALTLQEMGYTNVHAITEKFEDIKNALE
tara:strand:+ start:1570 stop:1917 length:348 start_codon:yes stop_codon:yes gene_type:complete